MKYSLSPRDIKIEKIKEDGLLAYKITHMPSEITLLAGYVTFNKEEILKKAIEELEWRVYYHELMNNDFNK